jgi:hypothetical protein
VGKWHSIWISELIISPSVSYKIKRVHNLDPADIHSTFVAVNGIKSKEDKDLKHGYRVIATDFRLALPRVVLLLDLVNPDYSIWSLRTAFRTSNSKLVGR